VSWFDWKAADAGLAAYARRVIAVRRAHPVLCRDRYLADPGYVVWYTPKGRSMTVSHWRSGANLGAEGVMWRPAGRPGHR